MSIENPNMSDDKLRMINHLVQNPDVLVKSQQRNEPDLTNDEKQLFLLEFLDSKLNSLFLARFGKYLQADHLQYFETKTYADPDEQFCVTFHCNEILNLFAKQPQIVRNRRFRALSQMMESNDTHFSELELMRREPVLYEEYVGKHLSEEERRARDQSEGSSFLNALLKGIELNEIRDRKEQMEVATSKQEGGPTSSSDDESSDEKYGESEFKSNGNNSLWGEFEEIPKETKKIRKSRPMVTDEDRDLMKQEFMDIVYRKFIAGDDEDFDYSAVDNNMDLDDLDVRAQDEEDKYFDKSDSDEIES